MKPNMMKFIRLNNAFLHLKKNRKGFEIISQFSFYSTSASEYERIEQEIEVFDTKERTWVTIESLLAVGRGNSQRLSFLPTSSNNDQQSIQIQAASFLRRELPIRIAQIIKKLDSYPLYLQNEHLRSVRGWYKDSFTSIRNSPPPNDPVKEEEFAQVINATYQRHSNTLMTMAKAAHSLRKTLQDDIANFAERSEIQSRMEFFYMSRIAIRFLVGQYLALRSLSESNSDDMIGLISTKASPYDIALEAIAAADYMCTRAHGVSPEVTIHGRTDLHFPYVPSHINYIILELLKNSMRATVEKHGIDNMPPIRIVISDGEDNEDVVIKVSDEGGGIKRSNMNKIWSYLYTTADPSVLERMLEGDDDGKDFGTSSPLAGLGHGLPIARNYARSFGGELTVMSMEGYGTDSFIHLPRLSDVQSTKILI